MKITHKIKMDLDRYSVPGFDAVCGDRYTRELEIALYAGGVAWEVPADTAVTVRYRKPDGTAGAYDLLPDGTAAWGISGNVVTVTAAPQTLTAPGCVILTVCLTAAEREISTFQILMNVWPAVGMVPADSGDYWYLSGSLPQTENAVVGEVLVVESVDSQGRVTGLKTAGAPGLTAEQVTALKALLELAAYAADPTGAWEAFRVAFGLETVRIPATGITLSASKLSFGDTQARQLTTVLSPADTTDVLTWATSDPSVATVRGGLVTPVGEGSCTITASAGDASAACAVTVDFPEELVTYGITYHLTNATCSESVAVIEAGSSFTADIIANDGYTLDTVTVTMGGVDISSDAVSDDFIAIGSVTGDIVITAAAVQAAEPEAWYPVTWVQKPGYYKAGTLTSHDAVSNTGLIAVGSATTYRFTCSRDANYYIAYFDSAEAYIGQAAGWWTADEHNYTFPEGAAYFAPAYYTEDIDAVTVSVNTDQVRHTITANLTNCTIDTAITNVIDGSVFSATLTGTVAGTWNVTVTMGGVDITATAVTDDYICISGVTGDVVITAEVVTV